MTRFFTSFFIPILLFCNCLIAQNTLEYNLTIGDSLKVYQKSTQDILQTMDGVDQKIISVIEGKLTFIIESATDSSYHIKFKFDHLIMTSTSPSLGIIVDIDSNKEVTAGDIQGKMFANITNSYLNMEMLKTGKVLSVSGTAAMFSKMIASAGDFDDLTIELMNKAMSKQFGDDALANNFEQMTYFYPESKVSVGDHWGNKFQGALSADNVWTLDAWDDTIAVSGKSDVTFSSDQETVSMFLTGTMETSLIANKTTGFIKTMSVKSVATGNSTINQMKDLEIPTTITTTTIYKTE